MNKENIIKLSNEKGFSSNIIGKSVKSKYSNKDFYYLWLCELKKWLADIHSIDINIQADYSANEFMGYDCYIVSWKFKPIEIKLATYDYEELLEEALKQSLKLI